MIVLLVMNEIDAIKIYMKTAGVNHIDLKAALIDMDGVLYDSMRNHTAAWYRMYALMVGAVFFLQKIITSGIPVTAGIEDESAWLNLIGLAILPTIVSTASLAIATRNIGATKASVLGVFEPITAILVGSLMFGEPLTASIATGIAIAIAAVTFMICLTKR